MNISNLLKEIYGKIPAEHIEAALFPNLEVDENSYSSGMFVMVSHSYLIQV